MANKKFIGLLTLALTLSGLVACGGGSKTESSHKHKFVDVGEPTKQATCTEKGEKMQECSICGLKQPAEIKALGHDYKDVEGSEVPATCTEKGSKQQKCSRCQDTKTVEIKELGHNFENVEGGTPATCTEAGVQNQKCSRCPATNEETIQPLGHDFQNVEGGKAATCLEAGVQKQECSVCHEPNEVEIPKLDHKFVTVDETEPEPGKAKVRLYSCENGCGETYFGFKATEVSANAGRLVDVTDETTGEVGKRFWGRPIGNKMELDEEGSATERPGDLTAVFDETVEGDLFEYVFDLTKEQVETIGETALCYCDAKPAAYLGGQDFWACDPSAEEWTPGMYIEGEKKGQPIEDYRYILYVDDTPVEFDSTMKAPVQGSSYGGSTTRGEFVMPYKFHLHEGENKISLRMAGGYRSVFYNFTFRAEGGQDVPPTPHEHAYTRGEKLESDLYPITCTCGEIEGYEIQHNGEKMNSKKKVAFNVAGIKAGQYEVYVSAMISKGNESTTNGFSYGTELNDGGKTGNPVPGRYYVQADAGDLVYTNTGDKSYPDVNINSSTDFHWTNCSIATINIKNGTASFTFGHAGPGYSIQLDAIRLIRVGDVQRTLLKEYSLDEIKATRTDSDWSSDKDWGEAGKGFKFNKVGGFTLTYESASAQKVTLVLKLSVKYSNRNVTGFFAQTGEAEVKTEVKLNGTAVTGAEPDFSGVTESAVSDSGKLSIPEWFDIIELDLVQGTNTISISYVKGGYSFYMCGAQLVK